MRPLLTKHCLCAVIDSCRMPYNERLSYVNIQLSVFLECLIGIEWYLLENASNLTSSSTCGDNQSKTGK